VIETKIDSKNKWFKHSFPSKHSHNTYRYYVVKLKNVKFWNEGKLYRIKEFEAIFDGEYEFKENILFLTWYGTILK